MAPRGHNEKPVKKRKHVKLWVKRDAEKEGGRIVAGRTNWDMKNPFKRKRNSRLAHGSWGWRPSACRRMMGEWISLVKTKKKKLEGAGVRHFPNPEMFYKDTIRTFEKDGHIFWKRKETSRQRGTGIQSKPRPRQA